MDGRRRQRIEDRRQRLRQLVFEKVEGVDGAGGSHLRGGYGGQGGSDRELKQGTATESKERWTGRQRTQLKN